MTENADEATKITKGAYVVIFLYGFNLVTIFTFYTEFFKVQITEWSGEQITNDLFEFTAMMASFTVVGLMMWRYRTAVNRIGERYFTDDGYLDFWKAITAIIMIFVLLFISLIMLLSVIAFILGTGFSLEVFEKPEMELHESIMLLFFFILGITFVTLAISEALKLLDKYLIPDSKTEIDSQKIDEIYDLLTTKTTGQAMQVDFSPSDDEA
ncbi:MAG: hypothetical protein CMB19_05910 [Euryarchaeota archaeon]|nr:hypothetical protein [Euryarchaeota archaeon]